MVETETRVQHQDALYPNADSDMQVPIYGAKVEIIEAADSQEEGFKLLARLKRCCPTTVGWVNQKLLELGEVIESDGSDWLADETASEDAATLST